jgi:hypothetical protein
MTGTYAEVKDALAAWIDGGAAPEDLPPVAFHFAAACHGAEASPIGTEDALLALTDECDECSGEGYFQDDSHPANPREACETCHGFGRLSRRATPTAWAEGFGPSSRASGERAVARASDVTRAPARSETNPRAGSGPEGPGTSVPDAHGPNPDPESRAKRDSDA